MFIRENVREIKYKDIFELLFNQQFFFGIQPF